MRVGKLFFMKNKVNGLVLDVLDGCCDPGNPVVMEEKRNSNNESQIWYEEHMTGSIRNRHNDNVCLEIDNDNHLIVNTFDKDNVNQQWLTSGNRVMDRQNHNKVLDVIKDEGVDGEGAAQYPPGSRVCCCDYRGGENQQWEFQYLPARYFYIRSKLHRKVLDVKKADPSPGAKVIVYDQKPAHEDNQLWYEDKYGVILSKLNDFVIDASSKKTIRLAPFQPGDMDQLWTIFEDKIVNRVNPDRVLEIKGNENKNGAKIIGCDWKGRDNQKWSFEYIS